MPDRELISGNPQPEDLQFEAGLRPRRLGDFTGQSKLKENLSIAIEAARMRGEAMDHVLLYGPPGLGKTTLACIIAEELQVPITTTSGPVLQKKLDLTGILSNIRARQGFFIDEIDRLMPDIEEMLYSALEDFRVDILIGSGSAAPPLNLLEVDRFGLDEIDQKIMLTILEKYHGGPVGLNTIAASISEEADTIEEVYEPYLIQLGFLNRTPRGRVATDASYDYFNIQRRFRGDHPALF